MPRSSTEYKTKIDLGLKGFLFSFILTYSLALNLEACLRIAFGVMILSVLMIPKLSDLNQQTYISTFVKVFMSIALASFSFVLFKSSERYIAIALVTIFFLIVLFLIRSINLEQFFESSEYKVFASNPLIIPMVILWALVFRGWYTLVFLLFVVTAGAIFRSRYFDHLRIRVHSHLRITLGLVSLMSCSLLSRSLIDQESSIFWSSYDQVFRGSIATGLSRWGFTDSNFGSGYGLSYHWLAEAISGFLARFGGFSEFESVSLVSPALGICFSVIILMIITFSFQLGSWFSAFLVFLIVAVGGLFDTYSIGTLWGNAFFLLSVLFFLKVFLLLPNTTNLFFLLVLMVTTLLTQSLMGVLFLLSVLVLSFLRTWFGLMPRIIFCLLLILSSLCLLSVQLFFFNSHVISSSDTGFSLTNWLQYPGLRIQIGGSPDSGIAAVRINSLVFLLWIFCTFALLYFKFSRVTRTNIFMQFFTIQIFVCILSLSVLNLGELNSKFWAPVSVLGSVLGFGVLGSLAVSLGRSKSISLLAFCSMVFVVSQHRFVRLVLHNFGNGSLMILSVFFCFVVCLFVLGINSFGRKPLARFWEYTSACFLVCLFLLPRFSEFRTVQLFQKHGSAAPMFGTSDVRNCLAFIRDTTPRDTIIGTDLWSIPNSFDEKYFLVSMFTQRRVLIDGPYYSQGLNWPSRRFFEDLKNIHTEFGNSLNPDLGSQLNEIGASYFLLDTRYLDPERRWNSHVGANFVFQNASCSVVKL